MTAPAALAAPPPPPRRASAGSGTVARLVLRSVVPPTLVVLAAATALAGLAGLGQALVLVGVVPGPALVVRLAWGAGLASLAVALPAAALGGVASGLRQLRDEGAWLGLATLGVPGRALAVPLAGWLAGAAAVYAGVCHVAEPVGRAALRDARASAAAEIRPAEGETVAIGAWSVAREGERLLFAGDGWFGEAQAWSLEPAEGAVVARLEGVTLREPARGTSATVASLVLPVPLGAGPRVGIGERTTATLLPSLGPTASAYERWVLWKRTLLPVGLAVLGLALVPPAIGGRAPPLALAAGAMFAFWGGIRVLDQSVATLGPAAAAGIALAAVLGVLGWAWARWGDR